MAHSARPRRVLTTNEWWESRVDEYLSEQEQVDELKSLVRQNAPWALAGIVIGLAALVGYQQWQAWLERQSFTASQKYSATIDALSRRDANSAQKLVDELKSGYSRTPYADMAELLMARFEVETGKLDDAATLLGAIAVGAHDENLRNVAYLRLARVQRAQQKPDAALATLAKAKPDAAAPVFAEVKGDVLLDKGDKAGALAAWKEALAGKVDGLVNRELLELKISSLGGSVSTPVAAQGGTP